MIDDAARQALPSGSDRPGHWRQVTTVPASHGPVQIAAAVAGAGHRRTAEERRAQVLEAAINEFAVRGLHGATTAAIAARADIFQLYLFALFGDKKALFLAAQDRTGDDIRTALTQACRTATSGESPAITLQLPQAPHLP